MAVKITMKRMKELQAEHCCSQSIAKKMIIREQIKEAAFTAKSTNDLRLVLVDVLEFLV